MKRRILFFSCAALVCALFFFGCGNSKSAASQSPAENTASAAGADSRRSLAITRANNFAIEYLPDQAKLLTDSDGNKRLLIPKGREAPPGYEGIQIIPTPINNALYTATPQVGFIDALSKALGDDSLFASIGGVMNAREEWVIPQILEGLEKGTIEFIPQDFRTVINIESVVSLSPELVFTGGLSEAQVLLRAMLDEAGIPYVTVTNWTEPDNDAGLEWLKFFAAFYNLDELADELFEAKLARMEELSKITAGIPDSQRPTVAMGMVYDGIVYTQGGQSTTAQELYRAGGLYAFRDAPGRAGINLGMEEFINRARDADVLIYTSLAEYCPDKKALLDADPLLGELKAFKEDRIFILGKGYYMNSAGADEKFLDTVFMLHPELLEGYTLINYMRLPD
ncbi:MAG: ABC transporter substrate-binding protein [Treponema sp.]|jgi:iron complex transport system substrate-binding protein|nr:ABC transporter substrate-binding protein [Treponema sp.]